jgi:lipoprotein-releasing system permease protein
MYKLLLILRYLRRKLAPLFAALAVTLCTAMVIIVISVMGGFLQLMRTSAKTLTGDVIVRSDLNGFPHYEELITRLEARPEIDAAAPIIRTFGLANIAGQNFPVEVEGIDPQRMDRVTSLHDRMHWSSDDLLGEMMPSRDGARFMPPESKAFMSRMEAELRATDLKEFGMRMQTPSTWGEHPAMVPGIAVSQFNTRDENGQYDIAWSLVERKVALTVLRISTRGQPVEPATDEFAVVNEFKSGLYEIDANRIYVGFDHLQKMLRMDGYTERPFDPLTGEYIDGAPGIVVPGRASEVTVRAAATMTVDGRSVPVTLEMAKLAVQEEVDRLVKEKADVSFLRVMTWEQRHGTFLNAVQKEKMLLTILFAIISVVAIAMIGVIFYMIVLEKTRDIGILRAVGASRGGIMGIFVGYGLAIGIVGAGLGLLLATLIVLNINDIQDWLATELGGALFYAVCVVGGGIVGAIIGLVAGVATGRLRDRVGVWLFGGGGLFATMGLIAAFVTLRTATSFGDSLNQYFGFRMWDPRIYYFDRIPSQIDVKEVAVIVAIAILSSVLGSVVPAILASLVDPVESLRYE